MVGGDLIKLAHKKASFFLATEIGNVRGIQQKGDSSLLALKREGHMTRNCGWSPGAEWSQADSQQRNRDPSPTTGRIKFCSNHLGLHKFFKPQMKRDPGLMLILSLRDYSVLRPDPQELSDDKFMLF